MMKGVSCIEYWVIAGGCFHQCASGMSLANLVDSCCSIPDSDNLQAPGVEGEHDFPADPEGGSSTIEKKLKKRKE
eukprot:1067146-Pelagomonas_calceolata.AAC.1